MLLYPEMNWYVLLCAMPQSIEFIPEVEKQETRLLFHVRQKESPSPIKRERHYGDRVYRSPFPLFLFFPFHCQCACYARSYNDNDNSYGRQQCAGAFPFPGSSYPLWWCFPPAPFLPRHVLRPSRSCRPCHFCVYKIITGKKGVPMLLANKLYALPSFLQPFLVFFSYCGSAVHP